MISLDPTLRSTLMSWREHIPMQVAMIKKSLDLETNNCEQGIKIVKTRFGNSNIKIGCVEPRWKLTLGLDPALNGQADVASDDCSDECINKLMCILREIRT